jgi:hypothetical protein
VWAPRCKHVTRTLQRVIVPFLRAVTLDPVNGIAGSWQNLCVTRINMVGCCQQLLIIFLSIKIPLFLHVRWHRREIIRTIPKNTRVSVPSSEWNGLPLPPLTHASVSPPPPPRKKKRGPKHGGGGGGGRGGGGGNRAKG